MYEIIKLYYQILCFEKTPQDVPFSKALSLVSLSGYAVLDFLLLYMSNDALGAVLQVIVEVILLLLFTLTALLIAGRLARYQQTLSALAGTNALITLFAIPATAPMLIPTGDIAVAGLLLVVLLMLWQWIVSGNIFRHALDESYSFGFGIAFLYLLLVYVVIGILFPEAGSTAG